MRSEIIIGISINSTLTEALAAFVVESTYGGLPTEVVASRKRRVLDSIDIAWAGSIAPGCEGARRMILAEGRTGKSTLCATQSREWPVKFLLTTNEIIPLRPALSPFTATANAVPMTLVANVDDLGEFGRMYTLLYTSCLCARDQRRALWRFE